jgi:hypothetical protein
VSCESKTGRSSGRSNWWHLLLESRRTLERVSSTLCHYSETAHARRRCRHGIDWVHRLKWPATKRSIGEPGQRRTVMHHGSVRSAKSRESSHTRREATEPIVLMLRIHRGWWQLAGRGDWLVLCEGLLGLRLLEYRSGHRLIESVSWRG